MKKRLPYMPLFVDDFLSSTKVAAMTSCEIGGYLMLLMNCWASGDVSLPGDDASLEMISRLGGGWRKSGAKLRACFEDHPEKPGHLTNARLAEVWKQSQEISEKRAVSGRRGGRPKKQTESNCFRFAFEKPPKSKAKNNHPKPPYSNTPQPPEGEEGGECSGLVEKAAKLGLWRAAAEIPKACERLGADHVAELLTFFETHKAKNDWDGARLKSRLELPLMDVGEGWGVDPPRAPPPDLESQFGAVFDAIGDERFLELAPTALAGSSTAMVMFRELGIKCRRNEAVRAEMLRFLSRNPEAA